MRLAAVWRLPWVLALTLFSGAGCTSAPPDCTEAQRVTREAMSLMADTARDESTQLRKWVRDGWDAPFDDLTLIRSVEIGKCVVSGQAAEVDVEFAVLGRLRAAGDEAQVRFEPGVSQERRVVRVVNLEGAWKITDIGDLEPHVRPQYAIGVLSEMANGDAASGVRSQAIISELRGLAVSPAVRP